MRVGHRSPWIVWVVAALVVAVGDGSLSSTFVAWLADHGHAHALVLDDGRPTLRHAVETQIADALAAPRTADHDLTKLVPAASTGSRGADHSAPAVVPAVLASAPNPGGAPRARPLDRAADGPPLYLRSLSLRI